MPFNTLTRNVGLKVGPLVVETLLKRYFDRVKEQHGPGMTRLRQDELLYDATFTIIKTFLEQCSLHTVEEVQDFANTYTPSPPWVHVVRLLVPMSCCDKAAAYLIAALGGPDEARRTVGGIKWWQVRGINGVDAQWIATKKDWKEAKKRSKEFEKLRMEDQSKDAHASHHPADQSHSGSYSEEMDEMRCILYSHGGGYYFGSVDQERYSIQRHARKINGRVFAVNYRLAPQYPFPCAIQDLLAAYLFLIQPPPDAAHRPVKPEHIVIAGDSAGGGISLALLQVIRDAGLPQPAGGVLISPWCDLTHSFPSVRDNTATDVVPPYGLCLQRPSTLWPPPSDEMTSTVRASLRTRIRKALHLDTHNIIRIRRSTSSQTHTTTSQVDTGDTTQLPPPDTSGIQTISMVASSGQVLTIDRQVHFYTQNNLIAHPLVSSALSYLGGLPPLLFVASDKEVLRDEVIYAAHKAANPEKFPVSEESKRLYSSLQGIEQKYGPTRVHLQVYDDAAHILPVLFPFTTPAKYCYRAIATFCKHVTGIPLDAALSPVVSPQATLLGPTTKNPHKRHSLMANLFPPRRRSTVSVEDSKSSLVAEPTSYSKDSTHPPVTVMRAVSFNVHGVASASIGNQNGNSTPRISESREIVTSPLSGNNPEAPPAPSTPDRYAGEGVIYRGSSELPPWQQGMIRERVSTRGVIRPLESEDELNVFKVPAECIGRLSEHLVNRYLDASAMFEKKFSKTYKAIEKDRHRYLERAKKDIHEHMEQLQAYLLRDEEKAGTSTGKTMEESLKELSASWGWAWALDGEERPPASSIVSRRDTKEACRLARIADRAVLPTDSAVSGNTLWSLVVNFLAASNEKPKSEGQDAPPKPAAKRHHSWRLKFHHRRMGILPDEASAVPAV